MSGRFDHLEEPGDEARRDLPELPEGRFSCLEIGEIAPGAPAPLPPVPAEKVLCRHCGQANEKVRELCWACCKLLNPAAEKALPAQDVLQLVLDGKTYLSDDPSTPPDVRELMARIQRQGYSPRLLSEWRQWRATRNVKVDPERLAEGAGGPSSSADVKVFRGQRVSVIRVDGKTYTSDMRDLPPEIQAIFDHLRLNEVTPDLLEHLRRHGARVKYRPGFTAEPSDGDMDFWSAAGKALKNIID